MLSEGILQYYAYIWTITERLQCFIWVIKFVQILKFVVALNIIFLTLVKCRDLWFMFNILKFLSLVYSVLLICSFVYSILYLT